MIHRSTITACAVLLGLAACERPTSPTFHGEADLPALAAAPQPTLASHVTWGGSANDVTEGLAVDADGTTYLTGLTRSFDGSAGKVFIVKLAADASLVWQRTWDGPSGFIDDRAADAAVAPDGSVYIAGSTFVDGNGALLIKLAGDGTLVWQRTFGGNAESQAVAVAADGSIYVTGLVRNANFSGSDLFVIRFSADGTPLWFKTWGNVEASEEGQGIAIGPDGNVHVAGVAPRPTDAFLGQFDAIVLKLDPAGSIIWQRAFAGGDVTDARGGIAVASSGMVFVGGGYQGPRGGGFANDGLILGVTAEGALEWARRFEGSFVEDVAHAPDGSALFTGSTEGADGDSDAFLLKVDPSGRTGAAGTFGGAGFDGGKAVGASPSGVISLGAFVSEPPYAFMEIAGRTSKARITSSTPMIPLIDAAAGVLDPAGVLETPAGSTTYAGAFEAALARIAP